MAYDVEKTKSLIDEVISSLLSHLGELRQEQLSAQKRYGYLKLGMLLNEPFTFGQLPETFQRCRNEFIQFISENIKLTASSLANFKRHFDRVYDELQ